MKSGRFIGTNIGCLDKANQHDETSTQPAGQLRWWLALMFITLICGFSAQAQGSGPQASDYQHRRNVSSCGYDLGDCNEALLTPSEQRQVVAIRRRLNVTACGYGFGLCNQGLLTPSESADVSLILRRRNVTGCAYGLGQCTEGLLTPAEATLVRSLQARLAAMQSRYTVPAKTKPLATVPTPAAVPTSAPVVTSTFANTLIAPIGVPVAENRSYYGELNKNGVPKTVQVQGYTKANGTYVQGYYRSAPGTNPTK